MDYHSCIYDYRGSTCPFDAPGEGEYPYYLFKSQICLTSLQKERECFSSECVVLSATILSSLDTTQDPCENFYEYASELYSVSQPSAYLAHAYKPEVGARHILFPRIRVGSAASVFFSKKISRL